MTIEDKELLLKDLSARVPYGVKYMRYSWNYDTDQELPVVETLECVDKDGYIDHRQVYTVDDIKPCLFPLSRMTNEQKKEIDKIYINSIDDDSVSLRYHSEGYWDDVTEAGFSDYLWIIDWFNKNHFDYQGLIKKGLAIDATGKNVY